MSKKLFTSESVFIGHPDKVCDQISDAILDACLEQDPASRVACEAMVCPDRVILAGEITTKAELDFEAIVRETVKKIGYIHDGIGFKADDLVIENHLHTQSPDISQGVDVGGAGDNGLMFGGACSDTPDMMPLPIAVSRALERNFRKVCIEDDDFAALFRPDGKTQVTIDYSDETPIVTCVVFNVQTTQEAEDDGKYRDELKTRVIRPTLKEFGLEWSLPNCECAGEVIHINPTGKFVVGGPFGDCGLTGRKIVVATYGGYYRHGGGAQSGKDPSKVDKSAVMMTRYIAKNIVAAGIAKNVEVQLAYAIGVVQPVSISFFHGGLLDKQKVALEKAVRKVFDCSVAGITEAFKLRKPFDERGFLYADCAAYGYVGGDVEAEVQTKLPWEQCDKVAELTTAYKAALAEA